MSAPHYHLHFLAAKFAFRAKDQSDDGMEWVRLEKIGRLASIPGAVDARFEQYENLTPLAVLVHKAREKAPYRGAAIQTLIANGACLFDQDEVGKALLESEAFGIREYAHAYLGVLQRINLGQHGIERDEQGRTFSHLIAHTIPQAFGQIGKNVVSEEDHSANETLLATADNQGDLPLHVLLGPEGALAKPELSYPGEQLCEALTVIYSTYPQAWDAPNAQGKTPVELLADRLRQRQDNQMYLDRIAPYLPSHILGAAKALMVSQDISRDTARVGSSRPRSPRL